MAWFIEDSFTFDDDASKTIYMASGPEDGPLLIFIHGWFGYVAVILKRAWEIVRGNLIIVNMSKKRFHAKSLSS
jgi:hypothetical protein